jgi:LysR family hydrogen peroxide-inducible transcriptional activator
VLVRPEGEDSLPVPDPASLSERRLLLLEEGHCFRDQALSFCGISPATGARQKTLDGSSLTTLVRMVEAGFGVTLIPEMAVEAETRAARVSVARFTGPAPARRVGMVWRKTDPMRGHYRELADQIRGGVPGRAE